MNRKKLAEQVLSTLGKRPRLEARENVGKYLRNEIDHIFLNYDWVEDWASMGYITFSQGGAMMDGQQGLSLKCESDCF